MDTVMVSVLITVVPSPISLAETRTLAKTPAVHAWGQRPLVPSGSKHERGSDSFYVPPVTRNVVSLHENPKVLRDFIHIQGLDRSNFHQNLKVFRSPRAFSSDILQHTLNFLQVWYEMQHVLSTPENGEQSVTIVQ